MKPISLEREDKKCDYDEIFNIISTLILINPKEDVLESLYLGSSFSRVKIEERNYVVGIIGDTLCFGIPVFSKEHKPYKLMGTGAVFIPALKSKPDGFGYFMVFRTKHSFS